MNSPSISTGTSPQVSDRPINMPLEGTVDVAIWLTLRSILLDTAVYGNIPQNSGLTRPITIVAPKGTLANPIFPAPTMPALPEMRSPIRGTKALAPAVPRQVSAGIGNLRVIAFSGTDKEQPGCTGGDFRRQLWRAARSRRHGRGRHALREYPQQSGRGHRIASAAAREQLRIARGCDRAEWRGGIGSVRVFTFHRRRLLGRRRRREAPPLGIDGGTDGLPGELIMETKAGTRLALPSKVPYQKAVRGDRRLADAQRRRLRRSVPPRRGRGTDNALDGLLSAVIAVRTTMAWRSIDGAVDAAATERRGRRGARAESLRRRPAACCGAIARASTARVERNPERSVAVSYTAYNTPREASQRRR